MSPALLGLLAAGALVASWALRGGFLILALGGVCAGLWVYCQNHSQPWITPAMYVTGGAACVLAIRDVVRGHK